MQNLHTTPYLSGRIFPEPNTPTQTHQPAIKCPRCSSLNTKFCYYNNYNLAQPRHFCKSCRRYWTKGGVLRNVPVGGGCRKNSKTRNSKPKPDKQPPKPSTPGSGSSSETAVSFTGLLAGAEGFDSSDSGLGPKAEGEKAGRNDSAWFNGSVDPGSLFDVRGSADPAVYWNVDHWVDADPSLYLP